MVRADDEALAVDGYVMAGMLEALAGETSQ
jgi:hypothetical protein